MFRKNDMQFAEWWKIISNKGANCKLRIPYSNYTGLWFQLHESIAPDGKVLKSFELPSESSCEGHFISDS